ncbi:hypothetical protein EPN54_01660 [bacterium]|nr:MAG: hypothetical protein EPN54_01660 [bacterium]
MKRVFVLCAVLLAIFSFGYSSQVKVFAAEAKLDKVSLRLSWIPYVDYAFYTIGIKKGIYKNYGIDLTLNSAKGSDLSSKLIANREDAFGGISAEAVLICRSKGMPIKVLAVFNQKTPVSIVSLKKKGINKPKDLEGKSLATDISSMKHKQFEVFCKLNNVNIEKIKMAPIKGSDLTHILNGSVDAMLAFGYMAESLKEKDVEINQIKLSDYGIDIYGLTLATNEALIKENPDLVRRFLAATIKSWEYAIDHPEEAVRSLVEAYPELDYKGQLLQFKSSVDLLQSEDTKLHGLGHQSEERWEKTQDLIFNTGFLEKKTKIRDVFTNDFLP